MKEEQMEALQSAILNSDIQLLKKLVDGVGSGARKLLIHQALYIAVDKGISDDRKTTVGACDRNAFASVQNVNIEMVRILFNSGADVNFKVNNTFGYSTFAYACRYASVEVVEMLKAHANLSITDDYRRNPIQLAFRSGQEEKIQLFLENCGDNVKSEGPKQCMPCGKFHDEQIKVGPENVNSLNLLNYAVLSGTVSKSIVERLVQLGADVNGITGDRYTTLKCAIFGGNPELVKLLIVNGANVNGRIQGLDDSELSVAVSKGNVEIVKLLLTNGAHIAYGVRHPLGIAATEGNQEIAKLLLDHGANIHGYEMEFLNSPVQMAAHARQERIVEFLLDHGAREDKLLSISIDNGNYSLAKLLLDRGFDANSSDEHNGTPALIDAVEYTGNSGDYKFINLLLDHGARINDVSGAGESALIYAADNFGDEKLFQFLLAKGADINVEYDEMTALNYALKMCFEDSERAVNVLIRHLVLMKSQNLYISEKNLEAISKLTGSMDVFQKECVKELESLKCEKFVESSLSYHDILVVTDVSRLAVWASNVNIARVVKSNDFEVKFPIYGGKIVEHIDKGLSRNKDFELIKKFVNYLSTRKTDKLPKLPFTCVCMIFDYLSFQDVDKFRKL